MNNIREKYYKIIQNNKNMDSIDIPDSQHKFYKIKKEEADK